MKAQSYLLVVSCVNVTNPQHPLPFSESLLSTFYTCASSHLITLLFYRRNCHRQVQLLVQGHVAERAQLGYIQVRSVGSSDPRLCLRVLHLRTMPLTSIGAGQKHSQLPCLTLRKQGQCDSKAPYGWVTQVIAFKLLWDEGHHRRPGAPPFVSAPPGLLHTLEPAVPVMPA